MFPSKPSSTKLTPPMTAAGWAAVTTWQTTLVSRRWSPQTYSATMRQSSRRIVPTPRPPALSRFKSSQPPLSRRSSTHRTRCTNRSTIPPHLSSHRKLLPPTAGRPLPSKRRWAQTKSRLTTRRGGSLRVMPSRTTSGAFRLKCPTPRTESPLRTRSRTSGPKEIHSR